jgi:hypothetical protein
MRALTWDEVGVVAGGMETVTVSAPKPAPPSTGGNATPLMHNPQNLPEVIQALSDEQARDLCMFGASAGGTAVGATAGWVGGAGLGGLAGGALGSVVPGLGTVAGTAVGITAGAHFGARAGAWVGGTLGTIGGILFCPPGGG